MMVCRTIAVSTLLLIAILATSEAKPKPSTLKNHDLLAKLGLQKVRGPNTHHRKRLAVESRHHSRSDDSHMFIIKLPPNPHYYVHNLPPNAVDAGGKRLPVGFKSNGKPAKVYHWNMPLMRRLAAAKHKSRTGGHGPLLLPDDPKRWNEVLDERKEGKPTRPSYYVPAKPKKSFMKYFAGNGKPHSFYVIEKDRAAHYHRLLP